MYKIKCLLIVFLILLLAESIEAKKSSYKPFTPKQLHEIVPSSTRFIESLAGKWQISYDNKEWKSVDIPFAEESNKVIYLKRVLKIDQRLLDNHTWHLYFLGLEDELELFVNDQFIGNYFGGSTPFSVKINPKSLTEETNKVVLKILPAEHNSKQIKKQHIFAKVVKTGLLREVLLVGTPHVWVSDIKYKMKFSSNFEKCIVNTSVKISTSQIEKFYDAIPDSVTINKNKPTVRVEPTIIYKKTGEVIAYGSSKYVEIEKERTSTIDFPITVLNPELWSIENPTLYELKLRISKAALTIDEFSVDIGFREMKVGLKDNDPEFMLNGRPIEIKGVDYIEDYYHSETSLSAGRMRRDVLNMKTLGANLVRIKYNVPSPYLVNLCNKLGLLVLIELPIYDVPSNLINSDEIKVRMKNVAEKMINSYGNSPSVFAWGLYEGVNENSYEVKDFENYIIPYFKENSNNLFYKSSVLFGNSINTKGVDFILVKQTGMKKPIDEVKDRVAEIRRNIKTKPLIFNYGLTIQSKNHNGYSDPMSVEAQANYLFNLFYIAKNTGLAGSIIWSYNDYKLQNAYMLLNHYNQYLCTSGLLDRFRQQRQSYKTIQALFNKEKDPLFYAGSYSESTPVIFIVYGLVLSVIIVLLINRFKRFREYLFRSLMRPYNFYADIRDQRIMSTIQTYVLGFVISFTLAIFLSSILYLYRTNEITQYILMFIFPITDVQEFLYKLIWVPELFVIFVGMILFLDIFIVSSLIKLASLFIRARIFFSDTYTITIWAGTPFLFLLPFAIILNRLLVFSPSLTWVMLILAGAMMIWVFMRLLRSISVVFDIRAMKSYITGFAIVMVVAIVLVSFYHIEYSILSYSQYLFNVLL